MVDICLCGAGPIGNLHAEHIFTHPQARLVAVVDPKQQNPKALADRWGASSFSSLEEALQQVHFDAVLIASGTNYQADLVDLAAANGKGVFYENPTDLARAEECLFACAKAGVPLLVGFYRRFDPTFTYLKERIEEGLIGTVEQIIITSREPHRRGAGSVFHELTIHDFDLLRWLLGEELETVYTTASCLLEAKQSDCQEPDSAMLVLKTASGKLCQINNSRRAGHGFDQRAEVLGSKGILQTDQHNTPLNMPTERYFVDRYRKAYLNELDHFVNVMEKGVQPLVNGLDARQALILAEAAKQSVETNRVVEVSILMPVP